MITQADIEKVMKETGFDELQAFHHLQQRQQVQRIPDRYPLGKSAYIDTDAEYAAWCRRNPELVERRCR